MRYRVVFVEHIAQDQIIEADDCHFASNGNVMLMSRAPGDPVRDQWGGLSAGPNRLTAKALFTNVLMVVPVEADD